MTWLNITRSEMPMCSGISKAQPGTDGSSLCRTHRLSTQQISAWQPLSHSLSLSHKNTPSQSYSFACISRWKSYFNTCAYRCTRTTKTQIVSLKSDTLVRWRYHKNTLLGNIILCLATFMSLLCISPNAINSIPRQTFVHTHTDIDLHTAEWIQRGRITLSKSREILYAITD